MKKSRFIFLGIIILCGIHFAQSQDLLDILDEELKDTLRYTQATFKTTRLGVGHSVETRKKGVLQFTLGTRYWNIPSNSENRKSFVADRFSGSFGLEYATSDRFTMGSSITSFDGIINAYGKYRLLRQAEGTGITPIGITLVQSGLMLTRGVSGVILPESFSDRFIYTSQAIIAHKFNRDFSAQIAPTYIHSKSLQFYDTNNFFALGIGGRYRLGNHVSLFSEYYYLANNTGLVQRFNPFFLGVNWEIGYINFQLSMSNVKNFDETAAILYSPNNFNFNDGGLHFGVNVNYVLHFNKKRENNK